MGETVIPTGEHVPTEDTHAGTRAGCARCREPWPCEMERLRAEVRDLTAARDRMLAECDELERTLWEPDSPDEEIDISTARVRELLVVPASNPGRADRWLVSGRVWRRSMRGAPRCD